MTPAEAAKHLQNNRRLGGDASIAFGCGLDGLDPRRLARLRATTTSATMVGFSALQPPKKNDREERDASHGE